MTDFDFSSGFHKSVADSFEGKSHREVYDVISDKSKLRSHLESANLSKEEINDFLDGLGGDVLHVLIRELIKFLFKKIPKWLKDILDSLK